MNAYHLLNQVLGLDLEAKELTLLQISLRGMLVFIATLIMVRLGDKRFLARMSAFDAVLAFIIASMLARAVNGSAAFFPTLGGGFVLVGLHRILAAIAFRSDRFGNLVKGEAETLVKDAKVIHQNLQRNHITEKDFREEMRLNGRIDDLEKVHLATMERNGKISVVPAKNRERRE